MSERIIKFRAWDKEERKMHYNFEVNSHSGIVHVIDWDFETSNKKDWELMQYTGLKDKNGVEIYEGDLLKTVYPAGYSICEVKFGLYDNGEEYEDNVSGNGWYYEEWGFDNEGKKEDEKPNICDLQNATYLMWKLEVIGNIYENPNLLST